MSFSMKRFLTASLWLGLCAFAASSTMAQTLPANGSFESGDFTGWTATGEAFVAPVAATSVSAAITQWDGTYVATSIVAGEATTGTLVSDSFVITAEAPWLEFLIAGYSHDPRTTDTSRCYVRVVRIVDEETTSELARVYAPDINQMKRIRTDGSSLVGATVRIEVIDEVASNGYAWICVDDFKMVATPTIPPMEDGMLFENAGFESGDFIQWTAKGAAFQNVCGKGNAPNSPSFVGKFAVNTLMFGETSTGTLTSDPFEIQNDTISFLICGWRDENIGNNKWNYVTLSVIEDTTTTEIGKIYAPNSNDYVRKQFRVPAEYIGMQGVIEVVDDAAGTGFAWLGVDDFKYKTYPSSTPDPYILNNSFEDGFNHWTVTGDGFANMPTDDQSHQQIPDMSWDGRYWVNTILNGETTTGNLKSDVFVLQTSAISFLMNGYSSAPPFTNAHNYVALKLEDGTELARVWAPNRNDLVRRYLSAPQAVGKNVYIEIVDDNTGVSYAWLGVDDFRSEEAGDSYAWSPLVNKASIAPTIDGKMDPSEWLTQRVDMNANTMALYGGGKTTENVIGDEDLSGTFWFMWDDNGLYIAAKVRDNKIEYWKNQGERLNGTDIIQLCLDPLYLRLDNNVSSGGVTIHDFAPGQKDDHNTAAYWQHWPNDNEDGSQLYPNAKYASSRTNDGYIIEVELPWSDFPVGTTATAGTKMGYLSLLLDTDSPATATDAVVHSLWYNSGNGDNTGAPIGNPSKWQTMTLVDAATTDTPAPIISAQGISLNYSVIALFPGDSITTLVATVTPVEATNKKVIWTTSNPASTKIDVNTGAIEALAVGGSVITATTEDGGFVASMTVRVVAPVNQGSLYVTEVFINGPGNDDGKEWFELYNATSADINIRGWELRSNGSNGTIESIIIDNGGPVTIPAYSHAVIGQSADMMTSAGITFAGAYGISENFKLSNEYDEIILLQAGRVVEAFGYGPECKNEPIPLMHKMDFTLEQMQGLESKAVGLSGDYRRDFNTTWTVQTSIFGQMPNNSGNPKDCFGTPGKPNDDFVAEVKTLEVSHTPTESQYDSINTAYLNALAGDVIEIVDNSAPFTETVMFGKASPVTLIGKADLDPRPTLSDAAVTTGNGNPAVDSNPGFAFFIQSTTSITFENLIIEANISGAPIDLRGGGPYTFNNCALNIGEQTKAWTSATGNSVTFNNCAMTNGNASYITLGAGKTTVKGTTGTGTSVFFDIRDTATLDLETCDFRSSNSGEGIINSGGGSHVIVKDSFLETVVGRLFFFHGTSAIIEDSTLHNINAAEMSRVSTNDATPADQPVSVTMKNTLFYVEPHAGNGIVVQQYNPTDRPLNLTIDHCDFSGDATDNTTTPTQTRPDSAIICLTGFSNITITNTVFHHWNQMIAMIGGSETSVDNLHESWNVFHVGVPIFSDLKPYDVTDIVVNDSSQLYVDVLAKDFRLNGAFESSFTNADRPNDPKYPGSQGFGPSFNAAAFWTAFE